MRNMIRRFKAWSAARQERMAIESIRREMALMGFPLDDITDEEVSAGVIELAKVCAEMTLSIEEAAQAFTDLQSAMQEQARFWLGIYDGG